MDVTEQRKQFVELRSKGWPITKIAQSLDLPIPLLCVWLSADQVRISHLRRRVQATTEERDLSATQSPSIFADSGTSCPSYKDGRAHRLPGIGIPKPPCRHKHFPEQN